MIKLGSRHGYAAALLSACVRVSALASLGAAPLQRQSSASFPRAAQDAVTAWAFLLEDERTELGGADGGSSPCARASRDGARDLHSALDSPHLSMYFVV